MVDTTGTCGSCDALRAQLEEKERQIEALRATINELGRHDLLTGILNRRSLVETLEAELQRAQRTGHPFCFAMIDLDRFKAINERYGHPVGDEVLKTVSNSAMRLLRTVDRFGRMGGEEFGIILPATWLDQGMIAMQRLKAAVAANDWQSIAAGLTLSFSGGLTTNAFGDTAETIIQRAEKALDEAKQAGGNCVKQAEEALPDAPPPDMS